MKEHDILQELDKERSKNEKQPKRKVSNTTVRYLAYMGLSYEDMTNQVIPQVVAMELEGNPDKKNIKQWIYANPKIQLPMEPIRDSVEVSPVARRMTGLSQLISPRSEHTACISVMLHKGEVIISSNSPKTISEKELAAIIEKKIIIIRRFLYLLIKKNASGHTRLNAEYVKFDRGHLVFSSRMKQLGAKTIAELMTNGSAEVVPKDKTRQRSNRNSTDAHLLHTLLKLAQFYLVGFLSDGEEGFTKEELIALVASKKMIFITQNTQILNGKQLHAEQAALCYLRAYTDFSQDKSAKVYIGIPKLCCSACYAVLSKETPKIIPRGTHGMFYPGVFNIDNNGLHEGKITKLSGELCPSDSESECEFEDNLDGDLSNKYRMFKINRQKTQGVKVFSLLEVKEKTKPVAVTRGCFL